MCRDSTTMHRQHELHVLRALSLGVGKAQWCANALYSTLFSLSSLTQVHDSKHSDGGI